MGITLTLYDLEVIMHYAMPIMRYCG